MTLPAPRFLNVDLILHADADLRPLVAGLGDAVLMLKDSPHEVALELAQQPESAADAVERFSALVQALPPELRSLYDRCSRRVLDVGAESDDACALELTEDLLRRVVSLGAAVVVTIYPVDEPEL